MIAWRMPRRTFLGSIVALFATVIPGPTRWFSPAGTARAANSLTDLELARRLTDLLRSQAKVALLGKMVLWHGRAASSVEDLLEGVLPMALRTQLRRSEKWQLRRTIKNRVVSDYAALRIVNVGGWLLSRTESRIAALVALEQRPPG